MYAAAGGASLAGRKARQHGRQPAPPGSRPISPPHPAPSGVRAYSCQHWESRLVAPPSALLRPLSEPQASCDVVECAAGRAAWQEAAALSVGGGGAGAGGAARRCSVLGDHPGARRDPRKWHRNNRVRDASYGSSSESECEAEGIAGEPWGVARLLYAGLGTLALGLVVYFVGTGDKGFKTPALRLVGPSLIVAGLACCLLRIAFCIFAKPCCRRRTNYKENRRLSGGVEGEEMPLAGGGGGGGGGGGRGPAQCSPARRLDTSSCDVSSLSSGEEDERLRRYRTATTAPHPPVAPSTALHTHQVTAYQGAVRQTPSPQSPRQPGAVSPQPSLQGAPNDHQPSQKGPNQVHQVPILVQQGPSPVPRGPSPILLAPSPVPPGSSPVPSGPSPVPPGPSPVPTGPRRPPPRNVSFASGPDGELVLSPAQLRS